MANLVLPALGQDFGVPFASLQWVLVAYLLWITSPDGGGGPARRIVWGGAVACCSGGTGVFALASLLYALALPSAGSLPSHPRGRGAACMLVLSLAMAGQLVPPARRGWSMGLLGTLSACGTALGPSLRRPVDRRIWLAGTLPAAAPPRRCWRWGVPGGDLPGMSGLCREGRPPAHQSVAAGDGAALLQGWH